MSEAQPGSDRRQPLDGSLERDGTGALLTRRLTVPGFGDGASFRVARYLESRRCPGVELSGFGETLTLRASRRRRWWALLPTEFDYAADFELRGLERGVVRAETAVRVGGVAPGDWNGFAWRLELVELHRVLLGAPPFPEVWERLRKLRRRGARRTVAALSAARDVTDELWTYLYEMECRPTSSALPGAQPETF